MKESWLFDVICWLNDGYLSIYSWILSEFQFVANTTCPMKFSGIFAGAFAKVLSGLRLWPNWLSELIANDGSFIAITASECHSYRLTGLSMYVQRLNANHGGFLSIKSWIYTIKRTMNELQRLTELQCHASLLRQDHDPYVRKTSAICIPKALLLLLETGPGWDHRHYKNDVPRCTMESFMTSKRYTISAGMNIDWVTCKPCDCLVLIILHLGR